VSRLSRFLRNLTKDRERGDSAVTYLERFHEIGPNPPPSPLSPFESIFYAHDGRLAHKWRHYIRVYEEEFGSIRRSDVKLLEIGVSKGGSLQIWRKFLGEKAVIFGIDIDPECRALDTADLSIRIGSQSDPEFLQGVVSEMGGLDIVVDDGSHVGSDQITSFKALFPLMAPDGVYIIEDVQTAYWREFGGGIGRNGTIVSFAKDLIDDLNGWYHQAPAKSLSTAKNEIGRIAFYDGIVAIRKMTREPPQQIFVGAAAPGNS
jgi:hypothetical protein